MLRCELPNTDAYQVFDNMREMQAMLAKYGSPNIVWDNEYKVWRVPEFYEGRKQYIAAKTRDCQRWGCE